MITEDVKGEEKNDEKMIKKKYNGEISNIKELLHLIDTKMDVDNLREGSKN